MLSIGKFIVHLVFLVMMLSHAIAPVIVYLSVPQLKSSDRECQTLFQIL